jgi:hypothetical protein
MNPISSNRPWSCVVISSSSPSPDPRSANRVLSSFLSTTLPHVPLVTNSEGRNSSTDSQKERILAFIDAALAVVENDIDVYADATAKLWPYQQ